jgi:SAM-dependent methyltransferase
MAGSLYDHPDLYDLIIEQLAPPEQIPFYAAQVRDQGGDVLELACGTGRIALALARQGVNVTGLDLSPAMVAKAQAKVAAEGLRARFAVADMRRFSVERRFETIAIVDRSLQHLQSVEDFDECLASVRRHLASNGRVVFDLYNPDVRILARDPTVRYFVDRFTDAAGQVTTLEETTDYDPATQVSRITWCFSRASEPDFLVVPLHLRNIFPVELPRILADGGLRIESLYGDFSGAPFRGDSDHQICVCRAARE